MKIGLFFGSFNPIHHGHLILATTLLNNTDLEKVWLIVSPQSPFKNNKSLAHEFDRFDMAQQATFDVDGVEVKDIEFSMPKPSYTIDTLVYLTEKHPGHEFVVIIGEDNLTHFHKWKNSDQLLKDYSSYVYPRPGVSETDFHNHPKVKLIDASEMNISASYIRKCVKEKKSIQYLVPDSVVEYIKAKKIYE